MAHVVRVPMDVPKMRADAAAYEAEGAHLDLELTGIETARFRRWSTLKGVLRRIDG